ncbi:MAG: PspC domain-containing protein [Bdellovibrionaceae bacterium]|nr:PspC domain-containing protein [Bdellovibrionales bacterium]MCB9086268.1 PspC domain-containing protein [Pseudobdellovibrionaceae bacterium]
MKWEQWGAGEKWVRSRDGWLAGVCQGLGERLGIEPWILRAAWFVSMVFFGFGVLVYLILALTLPREDRMEDSHQEKFLGVCWKLSQKTGMDVGLVRFLTVFLGISSLGATIVGYLVLYFVLPENSQERIYSDSGRS